MSRRRILVTSALPYANGPLHLGHLAGAYIPADIYVRYQRMKGHDVLFICGTDEHGVPITLTAEKEGVSPREIVDRYHRNIRDSFERLGISFDNFSGTARPIHHKTSQDIFLRLHEKGYLEEREVTQLECPKCKRALPDRFVEGFCPNCGADGARGDQCDTCGKWLEPSVLIEPRCKICGTTPAAAKTRHWFFKLKSMQPRLEEWIAEHPHWKDNVRNFCRGWFKAGLEDRPITRDIPWGVPVPLPGAEGKVLYVWFDAPIGYISSTREWAEQQGDPDRWRDYWLDSRTEMVHFIGKDNIVFHAIVFPATLMAHGDFILASEIPANEFLNLEGRQLSTSRHWAVWVQDYLDDFAPDPLRYALARNAPETRDTDFTWKDFQARNNNELADILGNFINRSLSFVHRFFNGKIPAPGDLGEVDQRMVKIIEDTGARVGKHLEVFAVRDALRELLASAKEGNRYFDEKQPWATRKTDLADCGTTLNLSLQLVRVLTATMQPFLPFSAPRAWSMLGLEGNVAGVPWDEIGRELFPAGHALGEIGILFSKIEDEAIEEQVRKLRQASAQAQLPTDEKQAPEITIDEFAQFDLKVGEIAAADVIEGRKDLLRLSVNLGTRTAEIIARTSGNASPDALPGRQVVVVANVGAEIEGLPSDGLVLTIDGPDGTVFVEPDSGVANGTGIK
ncbi:MAG: methionine--tRNA ligase [Candidatus Eisenbacteria sp.]|nr:methionine--tRNA ligase [Candidatus Eisenbacteria bacterium]